MPKKPANKHPQINHSLTAQFSGPLPLPNHLEGYENVIPGSAERILAMAEQNAAHQMEMEKLAILETAKEVKRGQFCAVIVVICAFISSVIIAINGAETTASIIGGATVCGLVTAFIMGRSKNNLQR